MKKVLITGASGFIGSFAVEEGLKRNYEVYAGIRNTSSRQYLPDDRIKFVALDFSKKESLIQSLKQHAEKNGAFDYIVHNAGATKTLSKEGFHLSNYQFTENFITAIRESGLRLQKFIYISSLAAMGPGDCNTLKPISLSDQPKPISLYGKSKLMAENFLRSQPDFPYLILRPTGVYGPRDKDFLLYFKSLNHSIDMQIGFKKQNFSLIYVKDMARAIFLAIESDKVNKAYFVSDGKTIDSSYFSEKIKKSLGKKALHITIPVSVAKAYISINERISRLLKITSPLNMDKFTELVNVNWLCDVAPLANDLGFVPQYTLEQGIEETVAWYRQQKWL
jgi:nucleoside-diphosphate-sugar epimerase